MRMLNLICKKDYYMEEEYVGATPELAYKAGNSYVFFNIGDEYLGFDEYKCYKHILCKSDVEEYFLNEELGSFDISYLVINKIKNSLKE